MRGDGSVQGQAGQAAQELAPRPPVIHVGDNYRFDFLAAREAGLHAVLIDPLKLYAEVPKHERTNSIADFAERLAQNAGD